MRKRKTRSSLIGRLASLAVLAAATGLSLFVLWPYWAPVLDRAGERHEEIAVAGPQEPPAVITPPAGHAEPAASAPQAAAPPAVLAPSGEDTQADAGRPTLSEGRQAGLHRTRDDLGLNSSVALLMDPGSGKVLFEKNDDAVLPVASLTKLMTGLIITQSRLPMHQTLEISADDVDRVKNSRSRLRVGTKLSRADALQLALMSSENRAAHALGRTFPGGLDAFVAAMNTKARELGMNNTRFVDPTGLSPDNRSTAHDVALLAAAASRVPTLRSFSTVERAQLTTGKRTLVYNNSNRLVKDPDWDIRLQKTGYIVEAGQCVTMHVDVQGKEFIMVLLDAGDKRSRSADAERLRQWAARQGGEERHAGDSATRDGKS